MTSYDENPMYCATCRRGLSQLTRVATGGVVGYKHALAGPDTTGHDPRPVPLLDLADPILKCDFCSAEGRPGSATGPQWVYIAEAATSQDRRVISETVAAGEYRERHEAARRLSVKTEGGLHRRWGERWGACAACAELIEARDVFGLVRRVFATLPAIEKLQGKRLLAARGRLIDTYEHLFATLTPGRGRITREHPIGGIWDDVGQSHFAQGE